MKIEWRQDGDAYRADLSPFPVVLHVWPDGDDSKRFWASVDFTFTSAYMPANGGPFQDQVRAMKMAEEELAKLIDRLIAVFKPFVTE